MRIVVDTNIIIATQYRFNGPPFKFIEQYIAKGEATLYIPRIVYEEVLNRYRSDLSSYIQKAQQFIDKVQRIANNRSLFDYTSIDQDKEVARYRDFLDSYIYRNRVVLVGYEDIPHKELVDRALQKRKPFNENGKGYRDALIWETIIAKVLIPDENVVLISNNTKDFGEKSGDSFRLHSDLQEGASRRCESGVITLYTSVRAFFEEVIKPTLTTIDITAANIQPIIEGWLSEHEEAIGQALPTFVSGDHIGVYLSSDFLERNRPEYATLDGPITISDIYEADTHNDILISLNAMFIVGVTAWISKQYLHSIAEHEGVIIGMIESDKYGAEVHIGFRIPLSITLMYSQENGSIFDFDATVDDFSGFCRHCGNPILTDTSEACQACGAVFH